MTDEKENAVIERARDEIYRICVGRGGMTKDGLVGRQWTMSIPVRDDDSDRVFAALVDLATGLQAALLAADSLNKPSPAVSQPRKIYVVSTGRTMCEDYQIRGVFLDRDRALAWIETQPGFDERDLEEWYDGEVVL